MDVALAAGRHAAEAGAVSLAVVGFCYGGGRMIDVLAAAPSKAELVNEAMEAGKRAGKTAKEIEDNLVLPTYVGGVSFYGTRINVDTLRTVQTPLKLFVAGNDALVSSEEVKAFEEVEEELCQKGIFCEVRVFEGQPHGFAHHSTGPGVGDPEQRDDALQAAGDFLLALL